MQTFGTFYLRSWATNLR